MKTIKEIIKQLTRIGDSLMMIELTLLKLNKIKYTDIEEYAKDYNKKSHEISKKMEEVE